MKIYKILGGIMASRTKKRKGLSPKKTLVLLISGLIVIVALLLIFTSGFSADAAAPANPCSLTQRLKSGKLLSCPAQGAKLLAEVELPFPNSNLAAFPDGKDCATVKLEAVKSDGTFLENEPLTIVKPAALSLEGPQNTGSGTISLCFKTTKPMQARVIIKVTSLPRVNTTFTLNFNPKYKIQDLTDRQSFVFNNPITFIAQIDPAIVPALKTAVLKYSYLRRVNKWGFWKTESRTVELPLNCSNEGRCEATLDSNNTNTNRANGRFNYTFSFTTDNNNKFYKTFTGTLSDRLLDR